MKKYCNLLKTLAKELKEDSAMIALGATLVF